MIIKQRSITGAFLFFYCFALSQPSMIFVEGGTFTMGCTSEQGADCESAEYPTHQVTLTSFEISKYEVTQREWLEVMGQNPSGYTECGLDCPVERVSWYSMATFCNRLSTRNGLTPCYYSDPDLTQVFDNLVSDGGTYVDIYWMGSADGYRLPTEAEWEYAARGGQSSGGYKYAGSNNPNEVAWNSGNSNTQGPTYQVGLLNPNELGLYDMSGNVMEYVWDNYDANYYNSSPECSPVGPGSSTSKTLRGGNYIGNIRFIRTTSRLGGLPGAAGNARIGFRLAKGAITPDECETNEQVNCDFFFIDGQATAPSCAGGSDGSIQVETLLGTGPYTYAWTTFDNAGSGDGLLISNLSQGIYQITVTDKGNGDCMASVITIVDDGTTEISVDCRELTGASSPGKDDGQATVFISSGTPPFNISWSGPVTGSNTSGALGDNFIQGLSAGAYSATITDNGGCTTGCSFTINEAEGCNLIIEGNGTNPSCVDLNDGSIDLSTISGVGPFQYNWDNGVSSGNGDGLIISDLADGIYQITVTDLGQTDCTASTVTLLDKGEDIILSCSESSPVSGIGLQDGVANINILGGSPPYTISWVGTTDGSINDGVMGNNFIENLQAGIYGFIVEDNAGCSEVCQVIITEPKACNFSIDGIDTPPICKEGADGFIDISPTGGIGPYQFNWNNGNQVGSGDGLIIADLAAGVYQITVTDLGQTDCFATTQMVLDDGEEIFLNCSETSIPTSSGASDGEANILIIGGQTPYSIIWAGPTNGSSPDGQSGDNAIQNLSAGTYQVEVIDAMGCTASCNFTISSPACNLVLSGTSTPPVCLGENSGLIDLKMTNGVGPYQYDWDNGSSTGTGAGTQIQALVSGTYQITVTDSSTGCTSNATVIIDPGKMISMNCSVARASSTPESNDGQITVNLSGGKPPYMIVWTGADVGDLANALEGTNTITGLPNGNYNIQVFDENGCTTDCEVFLPVEATDECIDNPVDNPVPTQSLISVCAGESIPPLQVEAQPGISFNWYNTLDTLIQAGQAQVEVEQPGIYFVEAIRIADGCQSIDRVSITVIPSKPAEVTLEQSECIGDGDTYFAQLNINDAANVETNFPTSEQDGNSYLFLDIPIGQSLEGTAMSNQGCETFFAFPPPSCNCPDIAPPVLDNPEIFYCPNEETTQFQTNVNQGFNVDWYNTRVGGQKIGSGTNFRPDRQGRYFAETIDPNTGCKSNDRTPGLFYPEAAPLIRDIDKFCDDNARSYTIVLEVINGDNIETSFGNLQLLGNNQYSITDIPINNPVEITAETSISGCQQTFSAEPPTCNCDSLPAPTFLSETPIIQYCAQEERPLLEAMSPTGTSIHWYDQPQGGTPIASFTHTYQPTQSGDFYAATVDRSGNCISRERSGIRLEEIPQKASESIIPTCNLEDLGPPSQTAFPTNDGCDSLVLVYRVFDEVIPEILDTQYVCSLSDTGRVAQYETVDGCTVLQITEHIFSETTEIPLILEDTMNNCQQSELINLSAQAPVNGNGTWESLDGADIQAPNNPTTTAQMYRPGWNRFVWAMSNEACENYAADTLWVWNPQEINSAEDLFYQIEPGERIDLANLLENDIYTVDGYRFSPGSNAFDIENLELELDQVGVNYTGRISYLSFEPISVQFDYELCDAICLEPFCDRANVEILVCDQSNGNIIFPNAFEPHLGDLFDPLQAIENGTCDFTIDRNTAQLTILNEKGRLIFSTKDVYEGWNGRLGNEGPILPMQNFIWILTYDIPLGSEIKKREEKGTLFLYQDE